MKTVYKHISDFHFLKRCACDIGRSTYAKYEVGELNLRVSIIIELINYVTKKTAKKAF